MVLSDENIIAYQKLYRKHFGKDISKEDAYKKGAKLLRLISIVYRPKTPVESESVLIHQPELLPEPK